MSDSRIIKQASIIVEHSLKVKKKEKVVIYGDIASKPLVLELYKQLIIKGASDIKIHLSTYEFGEIFFKYATNEQINYFPKIDFDEIKYVDCVIYISSSTNTRALSSVDTIKLTQRTKVLKRISDYRVEKTRWLITIYPTESQAQEADMSITDYENFVYNSINGVNWTLLYNSQEKLRKLIDRTKKVRIVAKDTDLTLSISGRKAENCAGEFNMPDGEVFTSVVENSANGIITFSYPAIYMGREFQDIRLEFKKGKVISANSSKNETSLNKILDMDKGARFIGELGIGNNYRIKRFTKDILFDEKIGGSIHIALGRGYKETLSKNISSLHWDMIKDLRKIGPYGKTTMKQGGELWLDDELVQKNGSWLPKF